MSDARLNVIVIGAGLAGLSAGAMLREFADVTILETASELKEVGAAITCGPGSVPILRRYGVHLEREGGVALHDMNLWSGQGNLVGHHPFGAREALGEDIFCIHRADLHAALLRAATEKDGLGTPCKLLLDQRLASLDADAGSITLADGLTLTADVIVAADGIRSNARPFVIGMDARAAPTGESAYQWLVPIADLQAMNSSLLQDGSLPPRAHVIRTPMRKIVANPIRGGTVLNFLAYVPDSELHEEVSEKWTCQGSLAAMVKSHADFATLWKDHLAAGKNVGVWQLRDADPFQTWVKGRTILIGDAAHPMLPHQAAGAMCAIEDAEALAFVLRSSSVADVHAALLRAFRLRYKRAFGCQAASRAEGLGAPPNPNGGKEAFARWMYPGVEMWAVERPDMIVAEG